MKIKVWKSSKSEISPLADKLPNTGGKAFVLIERCCIFFQLFSNKRSLAVLTMLCLLCCFVLAPSKFLPSCDSRMFSLHRLTVDFSKLYFK